MPRDVRELLIFVGSPGDLPEERAIVREVAQTVNSSMSALGTRLSVYGWEDEQPARGRPQEVINQRIDDCDIFIGLLNVRWGSPTGKYSSGFEEEYERAMARRSANSLPRIALFFKSIDNATLRDPGKEVSKVLAFKRKQQKAHVLLYKDFEDTEDLRKRLTSYFTEIVSSVVSETLEVSSQSAESQNSSDLVIPDRSVDNGRRQISNVLTSYVGLLGHPPVMPGSETELSLDNERLFLFALALQRDEQLLPAHTANRLYLRRDRLNLLGIEAGLWLKSFASDIGRANSWQVARSIPAWAVLLPGGEPVNMDELGHFLAEYTAGTDASIIGGIFTILNQLRLRPDIFWDNAKMPVDRWMKIFSLPYVPDAVFDYITTAASGGDLAIIEALVHRLPKNRTGINIRIIRDYLVGDLGGVEDGIMSQLPDAEWTGSFIRSHLDQLSDDFLRYVTTMSGVPDDLRIRAMTKLIDDGKLTADAVSKIVTSHNQLVRDYLLDNIGNISSTVVGQVFIDLDNEKIDKDVFKRILGAAASIEMLRNAIDTNPTNIDAWEALAWKLGAELADSAREIIDTDFSAQNETLASIAAAKPESHLDDFVRATFRKAALQLIMRLPAEARDPSDIERARQELARDHWLTRTVALQAVAMFGTEADISKLLSMLKNPLSSDDRDLLTRALVKIGGLEIVRLLAQYDDEDVAKVGVNALVDNDSAPDEEIRKFLYSDHATVRLIALEALERRWNRTQIMDLLANYPKHHGTYYYNIMVKLDEILYRPMPGGSMQLEQS